MSLAALYTGHCLDILRIVLDPFSGAATTGLVAMVNGRDYIGIDQNAEYNDIAKSRICENGFECEILS